MSHPNRHVNHNSIDGTSKIHRPKVVSGEMKWKSYHSRQRRLYNWVLKMSYSRGYPEYMESNMDEQYYFIFQ